MSFDVPASAYDRFMGRFSAPLAVAFADWARIDARSRVLDVGSGPGALTSLLVARLGAASVSAVEPSESFVAAVRDRLAGVDVRRASAESLPFDDDAFDAALAQLVVHFMSDAPAGVGEMVRVTRPGGIVAACVWDLENRRAPHAVFLRLAAQERGSALPPGCAGTRRGELAALLEAAGCGEVEQGELTVGGTYADFDEWWEVHRLGVGASSGALDGLDAAGLERLRRRARDEVGDGPITHSGTAWTARGIVR